MCRRKAVSFEEVLQEELELIEDSRWLRDRPGVSPPESRVQNKPRPENGLGAGIYRQAHEKQLVGLAASGGGIRSGTFFLGVLQGLARLNLLHRFDYISTVSGGGYTCSWLTSWIHQTFTNKFPKDKKERDQLLESDRKKKAKKSLQEVLEQLDAEKARQHQKPEPPPLQWLRNYSNYLTPRMGMLSGDTWAMICIYLRNLFLNLVILLSALVAVLIFPRLWVWVSIWLTEHVWLLYAVLLLTLLVPAVLIAVNISHLRAKSKSNPPWYSRPTCVHLGILLSIVLFAWLLGIGPGLKLLPGRVIDLAGGKPRDLWLVVSLGTPLVILAFKLAATVAIGLMGEGFRTEVREWWGRLGGIQSLWALVWGFWFGIALYAPLIVREIPWGEIWAQVGGGVALLGWLATTVGGVLAGRSPSTGARDAKPALELLGKVAPYVFIVGLLVVLSVGIHFGLSGTGSTSGSTVAENAPSYPNGLPVHAWGYEAETSSFQLSDYLGELQGSLGWALLLWLLLPVGVATGLSWTVDINAFSMHNFYKNRLVRCYLGASNPDRREHPFTGFDPDDDFALATVCPVNGVGYPGPYPILNGTLNLTSGKRLAWQRRRGTSFVFTPRFCGYQYEPEEKGKNGKDNLAGAGFRRTESYGAGVKLGTALAISGAAVSPNMGYHSSAPLAFLMTVFNVRLGWWMGNPRHEQCWRKAGPGLGLLYLLSELFGTTSDESKYVYLSDGWHFENLGLFELVRRRCHLIVVCDAEDDSKMQFDGLGNAIEKCRTALGVDIEIDIEQLKRKAGGRLSNWHCAIGTIRYDRVDPKAPAGTLLYLKTSLTGDEPADVQRYAAKNPEFPYQGTGDQWFDEAQFESYRKLGCHVAEEVIGVLNDGKEFNDTWSDERLLVGLRQRWFPPSRAVEESFTRHTETVDKIFETLRTTPELAFLNAQLYPRWQKVMGEWNPNYWIPRSDERKRQGFYMCNRMIQLMENVYLDLKLEEEHDHPDNRGWMNWFRHWSWSGMFRVTWALSASIYGARFQRFCERHFDLRVSDSDLVLVKLFEEEGRPKTKWQETAKKRLNFWEVHLVEEYLEPQKETFPQNYEICVFELKVRNPRDEGQEVQIPFGFALVEKGEMATHIRFFRVQDHLRKMGLGRRALAKLIVGYNCDVELAWCGPDEEENREPRKTLEEKLHIREPERLRFEWMFRSLLREKRAECDSRRSDKRDSQGVR